MKALLKFLAFIILIVFFGWVYIMYLYLHEVNKDTMDNIKEDLSKGARRVFKEVSLQTNEVGKVVSKQARQLTEAFSERQSEMVDFIKDMQKEAFEIKEIAERFKDVSERTLRRDMLRLEKSGLVRKIGSTRDSIYQIVK